MRVFCNQWAELEENQLGLLEKMEGMLKHTS